MSKPSKKLIKPSQFAQVFFKSSSISTKDVCKSENIEKSERSKSSHSSQKINGYAHDKHNQPIESPAIISYSSHSIQTSDCKAVNGLKEDNLVGVGIINLHDKSPSFSASKRKKRSSLSEKGPLEDQVYRLVRKFESTLQWPYQNSSASLTENMNKNPGLDFIIREIINNMSSHSILLKVSPLSNEDELIYLLLSSVIRSEQSSTTLLHPHDIIRTYSPMILSLTDSVMTTLYDHPSFNLRDEVSSIQTSRQMTENCPSVAPISPMVSDHGQEYSHLSPVTASLSSPSSTRHLSNLKNIYVAFIYEKIAINKNVNM